ncbi:MAG: hypothetical protein HFH68_11535 [Lachnospiraceae bacterium]|nr:hypothetical protein [Lachnospiraceae bacterium]
MLSTKNGRSKCSKAKLKMAFIVTNVLFFIIVLITLINTLLMIRGQGWNSSIQLYIWLMDSKLDINNLWMFIHAVFLAFLSVNFIVLVILLISLKVKNPAISMCISFGILYALRNDLMNVIFDDNNIISHIVSITPVNIFEGLHMAGLEPVKVAGITVQWLYMAEILYIILLAATIVIFYRVLKNNHKYCAE